MDKLCQEGGSGNTAGRQVVGGKEGGRQVAGIVDQDVGGVSYKLRSNLAGGCCTPPDRPQWAPELYFHM